MEYFYLYQRTVGAHVPLNIKNPEVERLAAELSDMTGESKTQAIRTALLERRRRLEL
jgi:antitoxin VapB